MFFLFQAEDGRRDPDWWLEFGLVLFRSEKNAVCEKTKKKKIAAKCEVALFENKKNSKNYRWTFLPIAHSVCHAPARSAGKCWLSASNNRKNSWKVKFAVLTGVTRNVLEHRTRVRIFCLNKQFIVVVNLESLFIYEYKHE